MQKILAIAWNEARMSRRNWRVWLLAGLVIALGFFARSVYLETIDSGNYLLPAFGFWHPSFTLMMLVVFLGTVVVALDVTGRLARTGMHQVMYPLPVHSMQLVLGRFLGVLTVVVPIAALGVFLQGYLQFRYGHSPVVWQPYLWAFGLLVVPTLVPLTALVILLRTIFKHDFAAILALLASLFGLMMLHGLTSMLLPYDQVMDSLLHSSPNLGAMVTVAPLLPGLVVHALATVLFLMLTPLYFRRQEPQRSLIVRGKRYTWFSIPTFVRWISDLRMDPNLGWTYRAALVVTLIVCLGGVGIELGDVFTAAGEPRVSAIEKELRQNRIRPADVDVQTVFVEVDPDYAHPRVDFTARVEGTVNEDLDRLFFTLHERYEILSLLINGNETPYEDWDEVRVAELTEPLHTGEPLRMEVQYRGRPDAIHVSHSALRDDWYPMPLTRLLTQGQNWVQTVEDIFQPQVDIHLLDHHEVAFAGVELSEEDTPEGRIERWRPHTAVSSMQLHWGEYDVLTRVEEGLAVRFFHLPQHRYQAEVYLEEVIDQEEILREQLGYLPFPELTLIEIPYYNLYAERSPFTALPDWFRPFWQPLRGVQMPGLIYVSENMLAFMNEHVWKLDRMDLEPETVPFYRYLDDVRDELNEQYYNELIRLYYTETLNPVGELSFWLQDLDDYTRRLLERNRWRRQWILDFSIEGDHREPLAVARTMPLQELHESGRYAGLLQNRSLGTFRMLHHLLGDDAWWEFQRALLRQYSFKPLTVEDFIALAEDFYGKPLDWFVEDWLEQASLGEYEITLAEARLVEDPMTDEVSYAITVRVKHHGTGRMFVPIYIETEMDFFFEDIWLESGEEDSITVNVPHRPLVTVVDPQNRVFKIDPYNPAQKRRARSERKIEVLESGNRPTAQAR